LIIFRDLLPFPIGFAIKLILLVWMTYLWTGRRNAPCLPIDSITLTTVWRITGKIIRTTIMLITYAHL